MKDIRIDPDLISYCGLYCGACKSFRNDSCPGCRAKGKYAKCQMRPCCIEHHYSSCADCTEFHDVTQCRKFSNPFWRFMEWVGRVNRAQAIVWIREKGREGFAQTMAAKKSAVVKRSFLK